MKKKIYSLFTKIFFLCCALLFLFCKDRNSIADRNSLKKDTISTPPSSMVKYLALGDSYTIGQAVTINDRFPIQAVSMLRNSGYNMADVDIIATTGWTTGNLLNAIKDKQASSPYDFVSLLIGVNNQFRGTSIEQYRTEFTALLRKSIKLTGNRPERVIVVSIPDYSVTPFAIGPIDRNKIAREINMFNKANKQLSTFFHVQYLNVTEESRKAAIYPALIATDGLHFSAIEYRIWAELLVDIMKRSIS